MFCPLKDERLTSETSPQISEPMSREAVMVEDGFLPETQESFSPTRGSQPV